jgi:transposase
VRRTRRCEPIKPDVIVIGVDVAKSAHLAVAVSSDGSESKPLKFAVSRDGFAKLQAFAEEQVRRRGATGWVVAVEPTGHYATTLVAWLSSRRVAVYSVQPSHTSRAKSLYDGTTRKTDAKDALVIASLCRQGICRPYRLAEGAFAELRTMSAQRRQLVKRRSQTVNRLHRHVDVLFPELRGLFPKLESRTALWVLETMPTPADVLERSAEQLAEELYEASRWQLGRERAEAMLQAARDSIGITHGVTSHRLAVRQLLAELRHVLGQIKELEARMAEVLRQVPYAPLLRSIPQLGVVTVATLLGELGDLKAYRHAKQVIAMAGLDLVENSSGEHQGHHHISRRGRAYARQMLYLAALRLGWKVMAEPRRRSVEERKKAANKAAVGNMVRLLRVMFAIARDGKPFDAARMRPPAMPIAA